MLKLIGIFISIFLIFIIFIQLPQESIGLTSFANKTNLLGSPSSAQRFLDILTTTAIVVYFLIALKLNLSQ